MKWHFKAFSILGYVLAVLAPNQFKLKSSNLRGCSLPILQTRVVTQHLCGSHVAFCGRRWWWLKMDPLGIKTAILIIKLGCCLSSAFKRLWPFQEPRHSFDLQVRDFQWQLRWGRAEQWVATEPLGSSRARPPPPVASSRLPALLPSVSRPCHTTGSWGNTGGTEAQGS